MSKEWFNALRIYLRPEFNGSILSNDEFVVVKDAYPKARHHFLVLSKSVNSIFELKEKHISLIVAMEEMGRECEELIKKMDINANVKMGFHRKPSMAVLHMHVISDDMVSLAMKNKKHYNSFTTPFLCPPSEIIRQLREHTKVSFDSAQCDMWLKQSLRCHLCSTPFKTMPLLKAHLASKH